MFRRRALLSRYGFRIWTGRRTSLASPPRRVEVVSDQAPPSKHDQLAHLAEVEIPAFKAERDAFAARVRELEELT